MSGERKMMLRYTIATLTAVLLVVAGLVPALAAPPLKVTSAVPGEAEEETLNLDVEIGGSGFEPGAVTKFFRTGTSDPGGVVVNSTTYLSSKKVRANIDVPLGADLDLYDIEIELKDTRRGKGIELFRVKEKTTGPPAQPTIVPLDSLGGTGSSAYDLLDPIAGGPVEVIGNASHIDTSQHAVRWSVDPSTYVVTGPTDLGILPGGETSWASRITSYNVVVGSSHLVVGKSHDGTWRNQPGGGPDAVTQGVYWLEGDATPTELANLAVVRGGLESNCDAEYPAARANDANASGVIVGTSDFGPCILTGTLWWPVQTATMWQLDDFGVAADPISIGHLTTDRHTEANAVNDNGLVVGANVTVSTGNHRGFVLVPENSNAAGDPDTWWRDDDTDGVNDLLIDLGEPSNGTGWVAALGISNTGIVVGYAVVKKGKSSDGWRAFRIVPDDEDGDGEPDTWVRLGRKGENLLMEILPMLPVEFCSPGMKSVRGYDVTDDGIVVGKSGCGGASDAARWAVSGNIEDLSALIQTGDGWDHLRFAVGVTSGDRVAGGGTRVDGSNKGFLITP